MNSNASPRSHAAVAPFHHPQFGHVNTPMLQALLAVQQVAVSGHPSEASSPAASVVTLARDVRSKRRSGRPDLTHSDHPPRPIQAGERVTDLELASRLRGLVKHNSLWSVGARHSDPEQLELALEDDQA